VALEAGIPTAIVVLVLLAILILLLLQNRRQKRRLLHLERDHAGDPLSSTDIHEKGKGVGVADMPSQKTVQLRPPHHEIDGNAIHELDRAQAPDPELE